MRITSLDNDGVTREFSRHAAPCQRNGERNDTGLARPAPLRASWTWAACLVVIAGCSPADRPAPPTIAATDVAAQITSPPVYPPQLACAGKGGVVVLRLLIGVDGKPGEVTTERSSGQSQLDAAAVTAVRKWQFKPATRGGEPYATRIRVPVTFTPPTMRPDMCFQLDEQQRRGS